MKFRLRFKKIDDYMPKSRLLTLLLNILLLSISAFSYAETVYVSDNLRVGVRPSPDSSIAPINVVTSGMHLTVIENQAGYIKIRTESGIVGWVKEVYMTNEIPVREKFDSLKIKYDQQSATISTLNESIDTLTKVKLALIKDIDTIRTDKSDVELKLARIVEEKYVDDISNSKNSLIVISVILFVVAFVLGVLWHRAFVTRRLGGLRL